MIKDLDGTICKPFQAFTCSDLRFFCMCCYMLLHIVTRYCMLLHFVTCCYMLLHVVYMLLHAVTCCYMRLHIVTCYYMLLHAVPCSYTLSHAATCCHMLSHAVICRVAFYNMLSHFTLPTFTIFKKENLVPIVQVLEFIILYLIST